MNLLLQYLLNGNDIKTTYGITISDSRGLFNFPGLKEPVKGEWPDEHGSIVDLTEPTYRERTIELDCWMKGTDAQDLISKINAFVAEITKAGLQQLMVQYDDEQEQPLIYMVYLDGEIDFEKEWSQGEMTTQFTLVLIEPEPGKKIFWMDACHGNMYAYFNAWTTEHKLNFYWGDGTTTKDVSGTSFDLKHDYDTEGVYWIVVTGRVELIDWENVTSNCEIIW